MFVSADLIPWEKHVELFIGLFSVEVQISPVFIVSAEAVVCLPEAVRCSTVWSDAVFTVSVQTHLGVD